MHTDYTSHVHRFGLRFVLQCKFTSAGAIAVSFFRMTFCMNDQKDHWINQCKGRLLDGSKLHTITLQVPAISMAVPIIQKIDENRFYSFPSQLQQWHCTDCRRYCGTMAVRLTLGSTQCRSLECTREWQWWQLTFFEMVASVALIMINCKHAVHGATFCRDQIGKLIGMDMLTFQ